MKFYPSTDPRSPRYPGECRVANEGEKIRRKVSRLRQLAFEETDLLRSRSLYAAADALSQRDLPLSKPKPVNKQMSLFEEPSINGADPETSSWRPS